MKIDQVLCIHDEYQANLDVLMKIDQVLCIHNEYQANPCIDEN
jgi:hypothetical protein